MNGSAILAGERWSTGPLAFRHPLREIEATRVEDVRDALRRARLAAAEGAWVVGYVSYQASPGFDPMLRVPEGVLVPELPLVWFGVFDKPSEDLGPEGDFRLGGWEAALGKDSHSELVSSIRASIAAGDSYQVNLTFPMRADVSGDPVALFRAMVDAQPLSYGAYIDVGGRQVVSVSPESFLAIEGRRVVARPMKGTAPRGRSSQEDLARGQELAASEKERAGNVMIVDMIRNDLGRVAELGSIEVPSLFAVERHPTVWQMTSTVTARLDEGVAIEDLFSAVFPSASITGAPKVSTMGIIAELEPESRGVYCGAIGYLAPGGAQAEFSVAIRTGVVADGRFTYHVGGGITYDSAAGAEYEECLWKALVVTEKRERPALLETMRYDPEEGIPLLGRHVARLTASAAYWGIPIDPVAVGDALSAVGGGTPLKTRLVLHPSGEVKVETDPMPVWDEPVGLRLWEGRVDQRDPAWAHKLADRARYPMSDEEAVEMLLVNLDGHVTETDRSNVMVRVDGRWLTPPVESGCLPGVYRGQLIDQGLVTESVLTMDDLAIADEIAVTNALRGWRKAVLFE